jgi:hypothetical protein
MPMDSFLIAPINSGLQTDLRPWLIAEDAWSTLNNMYTFRGRIRKRFGSEYMGLPTGSSPQALSSRFSVMVGTTNGSGNISGTAPGIPNGLNSIGQMFSIDDAIFTVYQTGTPASMLRNDGVLATATFDTTSGAFVINGATATTPVYFYPALPVMGLCNYELGPVNDQPSIGFDTKFAYIFASNYWQQLIDSSSVTPIFHGGNTNFFWTTNWEGNIPGQTALIVSNYYVVNPNGIGAATDDPIWWYYNARGTTSWVSGTGAHAFYFAPAGGAPQTGPFVKSALIILPFKGRLILLNTIENDGTTPPGNNTQYVNRCRFSIAGSPFIQNSWYEPNQTDNAGTAGGLSRYGGAGFIDASTEERIVSAEFIKDRLIVYFERSTWELAYTGNQIQPFQWNKINTELGSESTFSTVPFDKVVLTIGNTGVHACSGANVERIDNLIPDQIFEISSQLDNSGVARVYGIRDYFVEMVYWTFPSNDENPNDTYPNRVLVYNYKNGTWAFNDDCITCFGYFEQQQGLTWQDADFAWQVANFTWDSGSLEAQSRQVIAGNQQGFVFLIEADVSSNAAVMQVTNIVVPGGFPTALNFTIIDHTLQPGDYIYISDNEQPIQINGVTVTIFPVFSVVDSDTVMINPASIVGTYTGGAFVGRVSDINMYSKQWNPYVSKGRNLFLYKIDFGVLKTSGGQVTVDYFPSYSEVSMLNAGVGNESIMGTGVLETSPYLTYSGNLAFPLEAGQQTLWHPVYFQTDGEAIQIRIYMSNDQMMNENIVYEDFEIQGMILHTMPTTDRLQ